MIAEGVETEEQIKYLEENECTICRAIITIAHSQFKDLIYDLKRDLIWRFLYTFSWSIV